MRQPTSELNRGSSDPGSGEQPAIGRAKHLGHARARTLLTERPSEVVSLQSHGDFHGAVPTPDHFIPLLYLAGLAEAGKYRMQVLVDGYAYGSLSMTCYGIDAERPKDHDQHPAAGLPDPRIVPTEDSNT